MTDTDTDDSAEQCETFIRGRFVERDTVEAADDPTAGPWDFGGVAVADGDILHTADGERVLMTAEELAKAQYSPAASKLTVDHPEYDGMSPPVEATIGNNRMQYSPDGSAIVYDSETHDSDVAAGVRNGTYDVSIHAGFEKGDRDPESGAYIAKDIVFHDLSVVSVGDSPSNTAEWGGTQQVAAWARSGGLEAALADSPGEDAAGETPDDPPPTVRQWFKDMFGLTAAADDQEQHSDEPAESGTDPATDTDPSTAMPDDSPEETPDEQPTDVDADAETVDEPVEPDEDQTPGQNTVEVDLGEHDSITDLIDSRVDQQVEASREQADKQQKVDEIIAYDEDYDEDDREDLLAAPSSVVEKNHKKATTTSAAPAPGAGGARSEARAALAGDDDDLDDFGTGVSE